MTRDDVKNKLAEMFSERYDIDFKSLDEEMPVTDFSKLNEKLDSIEFLTFLFDVEDSFGFRIEADINVNSKVKDIIDGIYQCSLNPKPVIKTPVNVENNVQS